jgi:hypothetical protein
MISDKAKAAILDKCCQKVDCLARGEVIDAESAPDLPQSTSPETESAQPDFKAVERLIVEYFSAAGANVEFEKAEWVAQFDDPISLTSLAIELARTLVSSSETRRIKEALKRELCIDGPYDHRSWAGIDGALDRAIVAAGLAQTAQQQRAWESILNFARAIPDNVEDSTGMAYAPFSKLPGTAASLTAGNFRALLSDTSTILNSEDGT